MKRVIKIALSFLVSLTILLTKESVFAYTPSQAVNYANKYATTRNPDYRSFTSDCTNFVSQALNAGGYSKVGSIINGTTDDHYWYYSSYYVYSHSWTVADDQVKFQILHSPGGTYGSTYDGDIGNNRYNDAQYGDIIAYDFQNNGVIDHLALEVLQGYDRVTGWEGDLVDAHSSDHYQAYWTLQPYNSQYYSTKVKVIHISTSNY